MVSEDDRVMCHDTGSWISVRFPQLLWNLVLSFLSEARRDGKEKRIVSDDWVFVHSCTYSFYVMIGEREQRDGR